MQKLFNRILVPVDFSSHSKVAVEKASELANEYSCSITLLHVYTILPLSTVAFTEGHLAIPARAIPNYKELEFQLRKYAEHASNLCRKGIKVDYIVTLGSLNERIIEFVLQSRIDLVLIGQNGRLFTRRKLHANPDLIADRTNVPVFTVPANRRVTKLLSVVIPVTDFLPVRKLMYGIFMATASNARIRLLGLENPGTKEQVGYYLSRACNLIRTYSSVAVDTEIVMGDSVAEAVDEYSRLHAADLVILNPGSQTRMRGLMSFCFGKVIQKYAAPPILAVNPL